MFLLHQFSNFSHVFVRSQTRQTDRLRTKQHHRRELGGEEQERRWEYTSREICDGQGLASLWKAASEPIMEFTRRHGTTALLTRLALGQVTESPFEDEAVTSLERWQ